MKSFTRSALSTFTGGASESRWLALALLMLTSLAVSPIQAASPDFRMTVPRGAQVGTEQEITITGSRLADAEELLFHQPGITVKKLEAVNANTLKAVLVVAADAELGEYHMRVRTRSGVSYARNFWVSQFPNVNEVEPNDDFAKPQKIATNVTVDAEVKPEETDYYQITVKKGERISVEVEGFRANTTRGAQLLAMDPYVAILDSKRSELASADGSALLKQDSLVSVIAPEDGDYIIEVRDSAYQGQGRYRAHIGTFPRPKAIFPLGGKRGSEIEFTLLGDEKGDYKTKVTLPTDAEVSEHGIFAAQDGIRPPSANRVRVTDMENAFEVEPNDRIPEATPVDLPLPVAFNGVLEKENDVDFYRFKAKKGQRFRFQVYADKLGSPADTVINIYDGKGQKNLVNADDTDGSKDGRVDFAAPEDGDYHLRIADMLKRGGKEFVYRVEAQPMVPEINITMPEMQRTDLQFLKQFSVPRGGYYAMTANVTRRNMTGDLVFEMPALPKGVSLVQTPIPQALGSTPILLKAEADAPLGAGLFDLIAKTTATDKPVVTGKFRQTLDLVRGPQNNVEYYSVPYDKLPVAVVEELPFSVTIEQPKVPLVKNGTMRLKVKAHRKDNYDKKIVVRLHWKPPGITSPADMVFEEKQTELEYELNAAADAAVGVWKLTASAESDAGKGLMYTATPYIDLSVEEPFVEMKLTSATGKQAESISMPASVEALREFDGEADVQIFGLPAHATAPVLKLTKDLEALDFPIEIKDNTPVGQHKNIFCTVTIMKNGEPIVHRVGMGGALRVDPKPKEAPAAAAAPKQVADNKPKEKPLSRLEQLRLDAQKSVQQ